MAASEIKIFHLGDFPLQSGATLPGAFIAYKTFGDPTASASASSLPAIIYPTWFSGAIADNEWLIGDDMALSPKKYFIVVPALFGNGESLSPSNSNHIPGFPRPFPNVTFYDNVKAQHRLLTEGLGIKRVKAVLGWSMGAGQTYQWITQYPDFAELAIPFCGSARTSPHNQVFLEGVKAALLAAKGAASGGSGQGEATLPRNDASVASQPRQEYRTWSVEEREVGLKALGRVYAGWGLSQAFYRERLYETALGFTGLEDFMRRFWEGWALSKDPENLLVMLHTWQVGDCSNQSPYNGDFEFAMRSIKAKTLVLPSQTDLYFPPDDSEYEVQHMRAGLGKCVPFPSVWGHWAGGPGDSKQDVKWLDEKLRVFVGDDNS